MERIVLQSAGTASVFVLAAILSVFQLVFALKKPRVPWYIWGAALSFSGMLYAVGVFLEYNAPAGPVNHFGGVLELAAHVLIIHSLYGLSFAYFNLNGKTYHLLAGTFHLILMVLLWGTPLIVADQFVERRFLAMKTPFVESALGPLGPLFIFYIAGAACAAVILWLTHRPPDPRYKTVFLIGLIFWLILGLHDGCAALGLFTVQYLMEYGFLGFSAALLWMMFDSHKDRMALDQYRVITEHANDAILVIQEDVCVFSNMACDTLLGFSIIGRKCEELFSRAAVKDRPRLIQYYRDLQQSKSIGETLVFRLLCNEETIMHLEIRANGISFRNRPAILIIGRDITERIHKEQALREQEEKLLRLRKMESLGLLAGGVAHDLNNVLSGIVSYPELLELNLPQDSSLRQPLAAIHEAGIRASVMVQDLLTVARGVSIAKESCDLNAIIESYLTSPEYQKLLHYHPQVAVESSLDNALLNVKGSAAQLRKVVMNLASNAAEAVVHSGKVFIQTTNRLVEKPREGYETIPPGEYVVLTVSDDGPGILPEDLQRIFEPFYSKKVMGRSGTGLGLTVVWNVVQDHDGYIDIASGPSGTTFDIYFPATREAVIGRKRGKTSSLERGSGQTILVVDDVKTQCDITCMMLEALGYRAFAVESGEAAVAYLKDHPVDLVILDMIMDRGMNGRDTYDHILKIRPGQKAIIMSGQAKTDLVSETLRMGAALYLKKPLILQELGQAVKEVLSP